MRTVTDAQGTVWKLEIIIGEIPRLEQETGVHLLRLDQPIEEDQEKWKDGDGLKMAGVQRLMFDLPLLYRVIYSLCVEQVQELSLTPKEFGRRIAAVHQEAYDAFFAELQDFFQLIRQTAAATFVGKQQLMTQQMQTALVGIYDKIDTGEIIGELTARLDSILGKKFGALQDELASIPDR